MDTLRDVRDLIRQGEFFSLKWTLKDAYLVQVSSTSLNMMPFGGKGLQRFHCFDVRALAWSLGIHRVIYLDDLLLFLRKQFFRRLRNCQIYYLFLLAPGFTIYTKNSFFLRPSALSSIFFVRLQKIDLLRSCKITDFCSQNEILFLLTWASRGCWSHIFSLIFGSYILILPRLLNLLRVSEISTTQIQLSLFVELLLSLFVELRTSKNLVLPVEFKVSMLLRASVSVLLIY
jgi:hypothetical protein